MPNDYLDQVQVGGTTYDLQDAAAQEDLSQLKSQITQKANANGGYPEMTVGSAEQLLGAKGMTDKVPYLFRRSGGNGANRAKENAIVGGTIAWNQMSAISTAASSTVNGVTFTNNNDGTWTANGTATATASCYTAGVAGGIKAGHVYVLRGCPAGGSASTYSLHLGTPTDYGKGTIFKAAADAVPSSRIDINSGVTVSNLVFKLNTHDLTAALTPAVADYIYSLEAATAGAGIAKLHEWGLCTKDYYEYDAGSLQSVQVAAKKTVGFNLFDKTAITVGRWLNDEHGTIANAPGYSLSDYIRVVPNATYYNGRAGSLRGLAFDADKNLIDTGGWAFNFTNIGTYTVPDGVAYIRFTLQDDCIDSFVLNFSDSTRDGEYEPYNGHTYPLDSSLTLRGIPELDADNNLRYNGDVYKPDGTVERKYIEYTVTGQETVFAWYDSETSPYGGIAGGNLIIPELNNIKTSGNIKGIASGGYQVKFANEDKTIYTSVTGKLSFINSNYTTQADWLTGITGVTVMLELATPTTESADPYQETQLLDPYGTEEYIDAAVTASTPTRDVAIPVGHETYYPENATEKLAGLPWDFSTLIANTEKGFTATKPYSVNDFLIIDNQLYRVTVSIANGATITPNTNVTATTIGAQITALLNA